ncbi:MAG: glycerol-3-phosphate 1-O-acyltransferase PlsY [Oscillospiraceae bacterium]
METLKPILAAVLTVGFSYLFGSLNSAITVCRIWKKVDIRDYGSHNAGLTNVLRVFGKGPGLATLLLDLFKGIIAVVVCRLIVTLAMDVTFFGDSLFIGYVAGLAVMLGHVFPVYYHFHGGKGVLVTATTLLAIDPLTCVLCLTVFGLIVAISKYVSLGSILSAITYPLLTLLLQGLRGIDGFGINAMMACIFMLLIIFLHRANIVRLKNGTENKLSFGGKNKQS